jgi:hypothetical protein
LFNIYLTKAGAVFGADTRVFRALEPSILTFGVISIAINARLSPYFGFLFNIG